MIHCFPGIWLLKRRVTQDEKLWMLTLPGIRTLRILSFSSYDLGPATAKSLQSCPTLCDPIDGSPPGSPVPGILQARTLEWVAISLSNAWKWKVKVKSLSHVGPSAIAAYQAPPSMGFSREEYWSGVPLPSPELGPTLALILSPVFCFNCFFFPAFPCIL